MESFWADRLVNWFKPINFFYKLFPSLSSELRIHNPENGDVVGHRNIRLLELPDAAAGL